MEYKKYSVDYSYEKAIVNIDTISENMIKSGLLKRDEKWTKPIKVKGRNSSENLEISTPKWFYVNPVDKSFMKFCSVDEQVDQNPNSLDIEYFVIYELMNESATKRFDDWTMPPHSLDYKKDVNKIFGDYIINEKGELTEVIYYKSLSIDNYGQKIYSEPIVKYEAEYFYNEIGYTTNRVVTRSWMTNNGEWKGHIESPKVYNSIQSRDLGFRRRKNLISKIIMSVVYFVMVTEKLESIGDAELIAIEFFREMQSPVNMYYEVGIKDSGDDYFPLYRDIRECIHYTWLDNPINEQGVTIRQYLLNSLNV